MTRDCGATGGRDQGIDRNDGRYPRRAAGVSRHDVGADGRSDDRHAWCPAVLLPLRSGRHRPGHPGQPGSVERQSARVRRGSDYRSDYVVIPGPSSIVALGLGMGALRVAAVRGRWRRSPAPSPIPRSGRAAAGRPVARAREGARASPWPRSRAPRRHLRDDRVAWTRPPPASDAGERAQDSNAGGRR